MSTKMRANWMMTLCLTALLLVSATARAQAQEQPQADAGETWNEQGSYLFDAWAGPALPIHYSIPPEAGADTRIVIVIPGARRNADVYREQWDHLAQANGFIVLVLEGNHEHFPTEWEYNAGGVLDAEGLVQPEDTRLFSGIEPLFDDFKQRFGSTVETYGLYGHSAGGGFVHRFVLFQPNARFDVAIAANPACFAMPNQDARYPFGLADAPIHDGDIERWLQTPLVVMLGELDTGPRTKPLSNGPEARAQGPSVYARGLAFMHAGLVAAAENDTELQWTLEVVHDVGHSNTHLAAHAVKYLLDD